MGANGISPAVLETSAPAASPLARRLPHLDILRAVAIILVLGRHQPRNPQPSMWGYGFYSAWRTVGWTGVDLFFVLSGLLVGGLLIAELRQSGHINIRRFYIRRGLKIWPSYLLFLIAATLFAVVWPEDGINRMGPLWPNWAHLQNYLGTRMMHTWSLAVEEHFYLVLPLVIVLIRPAGPRQLSVNSRQSEDRWQPTTNNWQLASHSSFIVLFFSLMALCLWMRIRAAEAHLRFDLYEHMAPTHLRIDSLFAGVFLAYLLHYRPRWIEALRPWRAALPLVTVVCFTPAFLWPVEGTPFLWTWGLSMVTIGSMAIVLWAVFASASPAGGQCRSRLFRAACLIGVYSYSIYLWHFPLAWAASRRIWESFLPTRPPMGHTTLMLIYVPMAIGIGIILYTLVERPALALRDRVFPKE